ncbi:MAG TPA: LUD domain-containing protein [Acidothermaceae bacterium]
MSARDDVLTRIRSAIAGQPPSAEITRDYRIAAAEAPGTEPVIVRFVDRLTDYKARVHRTDAAGLAQTLAAVLASDASVVLPPGAPPDWRYACGNRRVRVDGDPAPLRAAELDGIAAVVTGCRVAIAETGTIVLDAGPDQGRRVLTLVPDHHVVVVHEEQVVMSVPESLTRLDPSRPLTFISGPSATSDIEFKRVEGVHGPRVLDVIVVTASSSSLRSEAPRT